VIELVSDGYILSMCDVMHLKRCEYWPS